MIRLAFVVTILLLLASVECRPQFFGNNNNGINTFGGFGSDWGSSFQAIGMGQGNGNLAGDGQGVAGGASLGPFGGFSLGAGTGFGLG